MPPRCSRWCTAVGQWAIFQNQIENLKEDLGAALLPAATKVFGALVGYVDQLRTNKGVEAFGQTVARVAEILGEMFSVLTGSAPDAGAALTEALGPEAAKSIMGAIAGVRDSIIAVSESISAFVGWLNSGSEESEALKAIAGALASVIGTLLRGAVDLAAGTFREVGVVVKAIGPLFKELGDIVTEVRQRFDEFTQIGQQIVTGLWTGISEAWEGLLANIRGLVARIPESVRNFLGISSPSLVFAEIGEQIAGGLALGITNGSGLVNGAMQGLVTGALASAAAIRPDTFGAVAADYPGIRRHGEQYDERVYEMGIARGDPFFIGGGTPTIVTKVYLNGHEIATAVAEQTERDIRDAGGNT